MLLSSIELKHISEGNDIFEYYNPSIFVLNVEKANTSKLPVISSGIIVDSSLPEMEKFDDHLIAWYCNGGGIFNEILINEETALNTTHPIFIIDNAQISNLNNANINNDYYESLK